jgi:hypothetical protein
MSEFLKDDQWVWVAVQDPDGKAQFLGQHDEEKGENLIPLFLDKEQAQEGLKWLARESGHKYEAQAIEYRDLVERARENRFGLLLLKGNGEVLERGTP